MTDGTTGARSPGSPVGQPYGRLTAVRVGRARTQHWSGRKIRSGAVKSPVEGPVELRASGLAGDEQGDTRVHGGPDKAVLCCASVHLAAWAAEGLALPDGALFENFTVEGLTEADVHIGESWRVGSARVQVSQPRSPCFKLAARWEVPDLAVRVQQTGRGGWYLRVLEPGNVRAGDVIELIDRPAATVTVDELNRVLYRDRHDIEALRRVEAAPGLRPAEYTKIRKRLRGIDDAATEGKRLFGS